MTPNAVNVVANRLPTALQGLPEDDDDDHYNPVAMPESGTSPRDIVRLYQCRICYLPFQLPVSLPCGRTVCKTCLPEAHDRLNISYPAVPERLRGFQCPFPDCYKEHALGDCSVDVILNKVTQHMREQIDHGKEQALLLELSTNISTQSPWKVAAIGSLGDDETVSRVFGGGQLISTWALAESGHLHLETEVFYAESTSNSGDSGLLLEEELLHKAKEATRHEMDCQVCYALYCDPLTTGCGHTFCRPCLQRILDHSLYCPICRCQLTLNPLLGRDSCPSNERITKIIEMFWSDELEERKRTIATETAGQHQDFDIPLFVCILSFLMMPTFLHIFEPRYKLMIRRALEGDRTFGMVLPKQARSHSDAYFEELGTLLRIVNVQFYSDGRSLIETVGLWRFRVLRHGSLDGYTVGKIERIDDMSLAEQESGEASEVVHEPIVPEVTDGKSPSSSGSKELPPEPQEAPPVRAQDLETLPTQDLMKFCKDFVERMSQQSAPWLAERMLAIYGSCPADPAVFPWWFASMLPVRDPEKYRLLATSSVRERLKICCTWILEWNTGRWSLHDCIIL